MSEPDTVNPSFKRISAHADTADSYKMDMDRFVKINFIHNASSFLSPKWVESNSFVCAIRKIALYS